MGQFKRSTGYNLSILSNMYKIVDNIDGGAEAVPVIQFNLLVEINDVENWTFIISL